MPLRVNSPQDVYARNLISHRGYPLWTPEPNIELPASYQQEGLKIGDVGVVVPEDGSFDVFFNVTLPQDHHLHTVDGVPHQFSPVELRREDCRVLPDAENPGCFISSPTMECIVSCTDPFHIDGRAHRLTQYQFSHGHDEGAVLILPQGAERHRLAKSLLLLDVIIHNAVSWYRFAYEQLYRDIRNDALYLVTGFHKAQSWSLASFRDTHSSVARCNIVQLRKASPILPDECTWETVHSLDWRIGPRRATLGIPNQAVFIVGFKIAVNEELLHLKRVTVKVEHSERTLASTLVGFGSRLANPLMGIAFQAGRSLDTATEPSDVILEHDSPEDKDENVNVEYVPQISQPFHPSDIINCYLLRKVPDAKIAITHDSQWIDLLEKGILKQQDMIQAERLEAAISQEYRISTWSGAVYLECIPSETVTMAVDASTSASNSSNPISKNAVALNTHSCSQMTSCQWIHGQKGGCGAAISCDTVQEHMSTHGVKNMGRGLALYCSWENCLKTVKRESFVRHIRESHLGHTRGSRRHRFEMGGSRNNELFESRHVAGTLQNDELPIDT